MVRGRSHETLCDEKGGPLVFALFAARTAQTCHLRQASSAAQPCEAVVSPSSACRQTSRTLTLLAGSVHPSRPKQAASQLTFLRVGSLLSRSMATPPSPSFRPMAIVPCEGSGPGGGGAAAVRQRPSAVEVMWPVARSYAKPWAASPAHTLVASRPSPSQSTQNEKRVQNDMRRST